MKQLNAEVPDAIKRRFGAFCELHGMQKHRVVQALVEKLLDESQDTSPSKFVKEIIERAAPPRPKAADVVHLNRPRPRGRRK